MPTKSISVGELESLARSGADLDLVDVRTPAEFEEIHVPFARSVPLDQLTADEFKTSGTKSVFVICRSGTRGKTAVAKLTASGCVDVVNIEGGTLAWEAAGYPVIRGRKAFSLERQVRIAAGALVLAGTVLGLLIHPAFHYLAGIVGAGLVFAGITDTCGMAILLSRMPWNRRDNRTSARFDQPD